MQVDLNGKVAVVSGGSSGMGAAICERLAASGAAVVVGGRNEARATAVVNSIIATGGRAVAGLGDVAKSSEAAALVDVAIGAFGGLDLVINAAGVIHRADVLGTSDDDWARVMSINVDGTGKYDIDTGIGFLDHMLEIFSRHGLMDLTVRAKGDLHIDFHHTTEDTGIAIGEAVHQALGDRRGIRRYASAMIPMDETMSHVSIDVSDRPYLIWKVEFTKPKLGEMDTELFKEWFQAFAQNARITLHVENLYGENNHHIVESCFKALARALRDAMETDPRAADSIPSTKGTLGG